jgi:hypothetical protein
MRFLAGLEYLINECGSEAPLPNSLFKIISMTKSTGTGTNVFLVRNRFITEGLSWISPQIIVTLIISEVMLQWNLILPKRERLSRFSCAKGETTSGSSCMWSPASTTLAQACQPIGTELTYTVNATPAQVCQPIGTELTNSANITLAQVCQPMGTELTSSANTTLAQVCQPIWTELISSASTTHAQAYQPIGT